MSPQSRRRSSIASGPLLLLLLVAALPRPCSARIINVPANQPTLQAAVAAAATGDTVLFAPGAYTGGIWMPDKGLVFASRYLTTGDTTYIAQTVLSGLVADVCGGASGCTGDAIFEMGPHAAASAVIGLTMTNAVKGVRTSCRTDVDHCHAVGMVLAGDGVNYLPRSSGTVSNSLFMNNRDDGIDLNGDVSVTVVNNTILNNSDDGIEFRMYPYAGPTLTVTVTGNRFIGNGSDGIQLIDSPDSSHREVRIERNLFSGNQKATVGCMGDQNTSEDYSGSPLGEHVVFANNTCVGNFYGVCGGANTVVVNNIFAGTTNSALRRIGGNSICAYNLLWNNGLNYETSNMDLPHTRTADPLLDSNFKLTSGSPAIDTGIASFQWRGQTILNLPPSAYSGSAPDLGAYEFGGAPPPNTAPVVNAGTGQTVILPADAILDGTVSDDGLPNPPGTVTITWSLASGPAAVTFQNPNAVDTRATFTVPGNYSLRLTASDGALSTSATVPITVELTSTTTTFERRVTVGTDDAEESALGLLSLASSDLELVFDGSNQWVGLRFTNVTVPRGATIARAYLQFQAKELQSEVTSLTIHGQAADNPVTFSSSSIVSSRPRTAAAATWAPPAWAVLNEAGANQRSVDLAPVIQEIVNRPGWASGNAMVILISGTGHRTAYAFEGLAAVAPLLHIESGAAPPPPANAPPVVSAGAAQTITLPADAVLDGTVSDDGLPTPPGALTTTWSLASGPAAVTFQNANAVDTRATFTVAGTYSLRLTASDGALSASSTVQITVQPAPVGTATIERRIAASTDDAEEHGTTTSLQLSSFDIELVFDIDTNQWVGLRFTNIAIPRGATISRAYLQFEADEAQSEATNLAIQGQAADNPGTFSFTDKIASRPRTQASAAWSPAPWTLVGEVGPNQRSTDLSAVIQEIVNRPGWASGNALVLVVSGTGHRTARAFDAMPANAALLHIETGSSPPPPPPVNAAPVVDAGLAQTIMLPADAVLDGTVSDDGLPSPPGAYTTTWSLITGPAPVAFQNSSAVDTRATFTAPGAYLLRLAADDGGLTASDSVLITVDNTPPANVAPVVDAGPAQTVTLPADALLDGTVSDDGLPSPPGACATTWSLISGPAPVAFQNSSAVDTRVSFTAPGAYLLRLAADDGGLTASDSVLITVGNTPPGNVAPVVDAGPAQTVRLLTVANLSGTVSDDGLPNPPSAFTVHWSVIRGPGTVTFLDANAVQTHAGFAATGNYTLRLDATDGELSATDSVKITVLPPPPPNTAPVVNAGTNQTITLPADAVLDATVSDDGLPNPPGALTTAWSMISGPAPVGFQNAGAVDTRATFTTAGTYLLRLSATDGSLFAADTIEITVEPAPPPPPPTNTAPIVDAGSPQAVTLPADAILDATVSDDGLPNPPAALVTTWSLVSGPAAVTILNASAVDTRATFTVAGTYWLRLTANDGALSASDSIQVTVTPPPPANTAPVVSAGAAQTITLPADAFLDGTVSDDGQPNPPGALTTSWSLASGPAAVAFENPANAYTRATFSTAGTYVLRLTASDGALSASSTVQITVQATPVASTVERRIALGTDDAEESATGVFNYASADLELVYDTSNQWVGLRFTNVTVPPGAVVSRAYLQFEAKEIQSEATSLTIRGQAADNPATFLMANAVSTRPRTTSAASWAPAPWAILNEAGANQRTVDLSPVIQEIVNRPGWLSGNAMVILINGTGHRTAWAFEGKAASAPLLHIEAGSGSPPPPPPPVNAAPVVDAGPAQTIALPADAILDGTVSDDGLPNPPGALTTTWSLVSGPAAVTFQNANAVDTRATFTVDGTYSLRLTASDGALSSSATVQITVQSTLPPTAMDRRIAASSDDAEESATGVLTLNSSDLELVFDGSNQWVGMRFTNVTIPRGAAVTRAHIQFETNGANSEVTSLTIRGQAADNPATFSTSSIVSTRPRTTAAATWSPAAWAVLNEAGANQRTPDLSAVIQEIVNRPGWASGNSMVILINGTGHRTAWAFDGLAAGAPLLHIEAGDPPPPVNAAPVVSAGPAQTVTLPADAVLDGTVTDDGLPAPPALTTTWSLASGPAAVTFLNASAVDTRATFTVAGTYSLRLTASDGALSSSATVQITVQSTPPPVTTIERRIAAGTDDAEESTAGTLVLTSSDLEMVNDGVDQLVGMRFTSLTIPRGATITKAWIQFQNAVLQSTTTNLVIQGEAVDNAVTFSTSRKVSVRPRTTASASWAPVAWGVLNEAGANQRTPDLSAVVQQIVNRAAWASGNAAVILVTGTGRRTAWAYEGLPAGAPLLHIEYSGAAPPPAQGASAEIAAEPAAAPVVAPRYEFALHRLSPNPSRGQLQVEFSLADGKPATLQVLDVMGRRVAERDLGSPGPGRHVFELRQPLPPGLYAVRLVQGSQARIMKAIVVK
jgi:PKD repeat protein